jgi:hypothetical protein
MRLQTMMVFENKNTLVLFDGSPLNRMSFLENPEF